MKTVESNCPVLTYASVITDPATMTRKRPSDDIHYPPLAEEPEEMGSNKLPRFEFVTQIVDASTSAAATHHFLDFHNEKGQRIYLTDSENAEFVNIMLQENLLSVQGPMNGSCEAHTHTAELIELNSAELLDLDEKGKGLCGGGGIEESSSSGGIVTYVNNSGLEDDFEKQLVRVEIQDETPSASNNTIGRGQTINICHSRRENQQQQHQGNGKRCGGSGDLMGK